jgi:uncharacterized membrane protein YebE (DUF533 family)
LKTLSAAWLAIATALTGYAPAVAAHSDGAIWGIGGLLAGSMLTKAYTSHKQESQPTQTHHTAPPAQAAMTPEQKIQQLNALAAGGYITPQEYKTEKQAILNSIVE